MPGRLWRPCLPSCPCNPLYQPCIKCRNPASEWVHSDHAPLRSFTFEFSLPARLECVAALHRDTRALRWLTPPPIHVQLHYVEPLAENSRAEFTLWFGALPVRWEAVHSRVHPLCGFIDTQRRGPMRYWRHTHAFSALTARTTRVCERIEYAHYPGGRGLLSRLLFNPLALRLLFAYRRLALQRTLRKQADA